MNLMKTIAQTVLISHVIPVAARIIQKLITYLDAIVFQKAVIVHAHHAVASVMSRL